MKLSDLSEILNVLLDECYDQEVEFDVIKLPKIGICLIPYKEDHKNE